jgi:hypothetical protein
MNFPQGSHGISPVIPPGDAEYLYDNTHLYSIQEEVEETKRTPDSLPSEEQMCKELVRRFADSLCCENTAATRSHSASPNHNTFNRPLYVEFVNYGFVHRYPASQFKSYAPLWRQKLLQEEELLYQSIQYQRGLYEDITTGFIAQSSNMIARIFKGANPPGIEKFDNLLTEVNNIGLERLQNPQEITYEDIHEAGVAFERIRCSLHKLLGETSEYRDKLIEGAEAGQTAMETVEDAAFYFNDEAAKLLAYKRGPHIKALYRFTAVVAPKMVGAGLGTWTADEGTRKVFRSCAHVFLKDGGNIIADYINDLIEENSVWYNLRLDDDAQRELVKGVVEVVITLVFDVAEVCIFEPEKLKGEKGQKFATELIMDTCNKFAKSLVASAMKIPGGKEPEIKYQDITETVLGDLFSCVETADETHQSLVSLLLSQIPATMLKVAAIIATGKVLDKYNLKARHKKRADPKPDAPKPAKEPTRDAIKKVRPVSRGNFKNNQLPPKSQQRLAVKSRR